MKNYTLTLLLLAGLAGLRLTYAQTNGTLALPPAKPDHPAVVLTATNDVAITSTNIPAMPTAATNDPAAPSITGTNQTLAIDTNTSVIASIITDTNSPAKAPSAAGIPLIQFSDVPITTAIENLARQAGINYMLDPKISYGLPDDKGQVRGEPTLSIRWENITAEKALLALLDNYGMQLVLNKDTGISRVGIKDPLAAPPLITRVVQLQYTSVSNMIESVQSTFTDKRSKVIADKRSNQLVIVATSTEQQNAETLVAQLDKRNKQVLIETKLIEISSNPTTQKGIDWSQTLQGQNVKFGNGSASGSATTSTTSQSPGTSTTISTPGGGYTTTTSSSGNQSSSSSSVLNVIQSSSGFSANTASGLLPNTGFLTADGVTAVLSFLNTSADAQVVSTPRIVTLDNEEARIEITRDIPDFIPGQPTVVGGTTQPGQPTVVRKKVGTTLVATPHISQNDSILLDFSPHNSTYAGKVVAPNSGGYYASLFDERSFSTKVLIPSGNTLVIGGLIQDNPTASYTKVPVLGDIPGLGWAFRSESKTLNKDNLIVFLTPTIVATNDFQPTKTDYLQSKPKYMQAPMNPHSLWDGAEPRKDWSNPAPTENEFTDKKISRASDNY